jgi:5-methylcytosine-specific restriction endonuclease McrA
MRGELMPIKAENRHFYKGQVWKDIRAAILKRAGNKCEFCGLANKLMGWRDLAGEFWADDDADASVVWSMLHPERLHPPSFKVVLTTAHLDQDPANNDPENLRALCQRCHLRHDAPYSQEKRNATRKAKATNAGQK